MRLKNKLLTVGCVAVAAATLFSGVACNEHTMQPFAQSLSSGKQQSQSSGNARAVDILFVIDNSNSMREEQLGLDDNFEKFLDKLVNANADFRLAAVSTSYTGNNMELVTKALEHGSTVLTKLNSDQISDIRKECADYLNATDNPYVNESRIAPKAKWIDFGDVRSIEDKDKLKQTVQNLFRCEAIMGTDGNATEKGLATMKSALDTARDLSVIGDREKSIKANFKRDGSILAIVFVTDENDCSSSSNLKDNACETERNIEDSCVMTREDVVQSQTGKASSLVLSAGQAIEFNGETKTVREWCVSGDSTAREALEACLGDPECNAATYIKCPEKCDENGENCETKCANALDARSDYYQFLLNYVIASNEAYYRSQNVTTFSELKNAEERTELLTSLAESDIIIASIINRDQGVRYDSTLPENWCGTAGSQSYRYQLFAEMFHNDPIYAPICCKSEVYNAGSGADEVVCDLNMTGQNGQFGPVLSVIGERIGKAVNTLCADSMPIVCKPEDCVPGKEKATCPCNFGCNDEAYFENSANEYHLCNEFDFKVGTVPLGALNTDNPMKDYHPFEKDKDYIIDFESSYCKTRTGSPIQINLITAESGRDLVFDYPKQVSGH
jgi:hypothetical protein